MTPAPAMGGSRDIGQGQQPIPMARLSGRPLLLLLDVDGTLAPIAPHPSLARVPDETRRVIASLVEGPDVFVVLVSGRGARDARQVVGVDRLWTIGNHGAESIGPGGEVTVDPAVSRYAEAMAQTAQSLDPMVSAIPGVFLENKTWTLSVHYRAADDAVLPRLREIVGEVAEKNGLIVMDGKKILEVRPPVRVDKGTAIARIAADLGAISDDASILFAGDDLTDEDAFRYLRAEHPRAVTIHVGDNAATAAEFSFATVDELRLLLERIARESKNAP